MVSMRPSTALLSKPRPHSNLVVMGACLLAPAAFSGGGLFFKTPQVQHAPLARFRLHLE